ncbi:MAG: YdeI/OmpD-associated family protein [Chloroflexota bacterium]|nr:YdeI/OmpD-associated family protein [Chloroflexota bacterium]
MEVTFFESPSEFREWLEQNHDSAKELWVGFYKKGFGKAGITWPEAVDQALCFGWIDGIRKRVDETSYTNRFTPRRRGSTWSAVNIKRVGELTELGLMRPAGLDAFEKRDEAKAQLYSYERAQSKLDETYERQFREHERAWAFFSAQAPSYRRTSSWWVMSAKKEETRQRRLAALIEASERGEKLGTVTGGSGG